jgi:hypothetical protein
MELMDLQNLEEDRGEENASASIYRAFFIDSCQFAMTG